MWIYILLCVVVVLIAVIFSLYSISSNRFKVTLIKIREAEENIAILLKDKYQLLLNIKEFMGKKTKDISFEELDGIDIETTDTFNLNRALAQFDKTVVEIVDYNKDIKLEDEDVTTFDNYNDINIQLLATEKYYNDNVNIYNKLLKSFPSNIIAMTKKYKIKDIYSSEKEEIFEILKD